MPSSWKHEVILVLFLVSYSYFFTASTCILISISSWKHEVILFLVSEADSAPTFRSPAPDGSMLK